MIKHIDLSQSWAIVKKKLKLDTNFFSLVNLIEKKNFFLFFHSHKCVKLQTQH